MTAAVLKTAVIATIVAVLIWLYAESESVRSEEFRGVRVTFTVPPGSEKAVWLAGDKSSAMSVSITLEGPTGALDSLRQALTRPIELAPGAGLRSEAGPQTVQLREALRRHSVFRRAPVTITDVNPAEANVHVDDLVRLPLPVRVITAPEFELAGPAQASITQAAVIFPAALRDRIPDGAYIPIEIDSQRLERLPRDRLERLADLRLRPPLALRGEPFVSIEPPEAAVSLTLKSQRVSIVLPTVFVELRIAPELLRHWIVEIPPEERFLREVTVTGPADLIAQIERTGVVAFVRVLSEDIDRMTPSKQAVFTDLPGSPLEFQVENRRVSLRIKKREDPDEPDPEGDSPGS